MRELRAPLLVLDEHVALVRALVAEQLVFVVLDRADDDVDPVRLHVHPGHVAGPVVVGEQRLRAQLEVVAQPRVLGERGRLVQAGDGPLHLRLERLVVGHRDERLLGVAPHDRVLALERGGLLRGRGDGLLELLLRHVRGVEARAGGLRARRRAGRARSRRAGPRARS